jgi:eukaryotic-like serine/threonine-protein kinase
LGPDGAYKYRAFISYSHADEAWATWLHRKLERYRVPSRFVGKGGASGPTSNRLGRCFRDQAELSAASDLSETLRQALRDSEALIIICSPRSAASRWVNEEIRYFRGLGRGGAIFALIVDGEPNAKEAAQESLPRALLEDEEGRPLAEPLAADARPGRDGKADGFLKLVAGLLGVGLDDLRRREQRRRVQLMALVVSGSLAVAATTTVLAINASRARGEAELRRQQADDLINFMLGDLKERLVPVGRLDVLDAVTGKVMSYLDAADTSRLDDAALAQRIQALIGIAEIRDNRYQHGEARQASDDALRNARELARRKPEAFEPRYLLAAAIATAAGVAAAADAHDVARVHVNEGQDHVARLRKERPDDDRLRILSGSLLFASALSYARQSRFPEQMVDAAACAAELRPLLKQERPAADVANRYILCKSGTAAQLYWAGAIEQARAAFDELLPEVADLIQRFPEDVALRGMIAEFAGNTITVYREAGAIDQAERAAREGLERNRRLVAHDPSNVDWTFMLGKVLIHNARLQWVRGDSVAVHQLASEAVALFAELARKDPANDWADSSLAAALNLRARSLATRGDLRRALDDWDAVVRASRNDPHRATALLSIWEWSADRDPARARSAREGARDLLQKMQAWPQTPELAIDLRKRQMVFSYLSGDVADGDRLFAEIRKANRRDFSENTTDRRRLCERIARGNGPRCAALEEWKPLTSSPARPSSAAAASAS